MPENREPKAYLRLPYARVLTPNEESGYSAEILEFPGCFAEGETVNEAFANLEEVAESWIESCLAQGQDIPPPSANESYSGRIALRLPRDLHGQAVRKAARNGVSLNQCLVTAIAAWVGADNLFERLAHRVQTSLVQQNLLQVVLVPGMLANVPLSTVMTTIGTPSVQIGIGEPIQKLTARPS